MFSEEQREILENFTTGMRGWGDIYTERIKECCSKTGLARKQIENWLRRRRKQERIEENKNTPKTQVCHQCRELAVSANKIKQLEEIKSIELLQSPLNSKPLLSPPDVNSTCQIAICANTSLNSLSHSPLLKHSTPTRSIPTASRPPSERSHSPFSTHSFTSARHLSTVFEREEKQVSISWSVRSSCQSPSESPLALIHTPHEYCFRASTEKPLSRSSPNSLCESFTKCSISSHQSQHTLDLLTSPPPVVSSPLLCYLSPAHSLCISEKEKILSLCEQEEEVPLEDLFSDRMVSTLTKLGEGTFAEVFGAQDGEDSKLAMKIIPIEGEFSYNGERQSTFHDILPEMVVSQELSLLGSKINTDCENFTANFLQIYRMSLCRGKFPQYLLDTWDTYDRKHCSENDRPDIFPDDQLYIVFIAKDAGKPLEEFVFNSLDQANSVLNQLAATLAVAEAALEFEHRDLHQGNILVQPTLEERVHFRLNGVDISIETHGVLITVVDYTLSRICQASCVSYNDLNKLGWLFEAKGDLQFDIYRKMRDVTKMDWKEYYPYTNVLWLNYVLTKISQQLNNTKASRAHFRALRKDFLNENSTSRDVLNHLSAGVM